MRNLEWFEGRPGKLRAGMIVITECLGNELAFPIGVFMDENYEKSLREKCLRWAWTIQPYQLTWLESMNKVHKAKSRGE